MINKYLFKQIIGEIKSEYPKITILDTQFENKQDGVLWFAYTFSDDPIEVDQMRFKVKSGRISDNVDDELLTNTLDLDYDEAYINFITNIEASTKTIAYK